MVDLVITYVNNNDEIWKKSFIDYCVSHNKRNYIVKMINERYSGVNWVKYQLKLVKKNMPFVRKVFLVVSNKEQVKYLELQDNVEIITHDKFIPLQHLPTFNSTTIELFLPLIKDLSERFIYANDDMLPIKELNESDFFDNNKVKINWLKEEFNPCDTKFKYQCNNNIVYLKQLLGKPYNQKIDNGYFIRPIHSMTPMFKSHCLELYNPLYQMYRKYISAFRNEYNINQYVYPLYEELRYGTLPSEIDFLYTEFKEQVDMNHQIICVNLERNKENVDLFISELNKLCE